MVCPQCQKNIPDNAVVCPHCGAMMNEELECPKCGAILPYGSVFCNLCGVSLRDVSAIRRKPQPALAPEPKAPVVEEAKPEAPVVEEAKPEAPKPAEQSAQRSQYQEPAAVEQKSTQTSQYQNATAEAPKQPAQASQYKDSMPAPPSEMKQQPSQFSRYPKGQQPEAPKKPEPAKEPEKADAPEAKPCKRVGKIVGAVFSVIVLLLAAAAGFFYLQYSNGMKHLAAWEYADAKACFDRVPMIENIIPGEYQFASTAADHESGKLDNIDYLNELNNYKYKYPDVVDASMVDDLKETMYQKAVDWYHEGNYGLSTDDRENARHYFSVISDYKDSENYLKLLMGRDTVYVNDRSDELKSMLDFEDAKEVILMIHETAVGFLSGRWETSDGVYDFTIYHKNGYMEYSLPYVELEDSCYGIVDGHIILFKENLSAPVASQYAIERYAYESGDYTALFDVTVIDANTIKIYCHADGSIYTLYRQ